MRVQIPDRGIRSPDGGELHRGSFQSPLGLARLRHRGNFWPIEAIALWLIFCSVFAPGDFSIGSWARTTPGEFSLRATRAGDLLGDSLGSFPRSTPGEFSLRATRKALGRARYRGIFRSAPRRDRLKQGEGLPSKGRNPSFSAGFVACGRDAQTESYFFEFWQQVFVEKFAGVDVHEI